MIGKGVDSERRPRGGRDPRAISRTSASQGQAADGEEAKNRHAHDTGLGGHLQDRGVCGRRVRVGSQGTEMPERAGS